MTNLLLNNISNFLFDFTHVLALPIETNFEPASMVRFAQNNWPLAFGLVVAYLLFITLGTRIMKNYKPFDLQFPLAAWNAFLCIFSFLGMCRTVSVYKLYRNEIILILFLVAVSHWYDSF